jgi:hypothetical protein
MENGLQCSLRNYREADSNWHPQRRRRRRRREFPLWAFMVVPFGIPNDPIPCIALFKSATDLCLFPSTVSTSAVSPKKYGVPQPHITKIGGSRTLRCPDPASRMSKYIVHESQISLCQQVNVPVGYSTPAPPHRSATYPS